MLVTALGLAWGVDIAAFAALLVAYWRTRP